MHTCCILLLLQSTWPSPWCQNPCSTGIQVNLSLTNSKLEGGRVLVCLGHAIVYTHTHRGGRQHYVSGNEPTNSGAVSRCSPKLGSPEVVPALALVKQLLHLLQGRLGTYGTRLSAGQGTWGTHRGVMWCQTVVINPCKGWADVTQVSQAQDLTQVSHGMSQAL
jgi:hypothetical protein